MTGNLQAAATIERWVAALALPRIKGGKSA